MLFPSLKTPLKEVITCSLLAWAALQAQAQGTIQFAATLTGANEVPPNNDPTVATGTFALSGNVLNFWVEVPPITFSASTAYIQGPALPGSTGPIIFDLGGPSFIGGGVEPYYVFFSPFDGLLGAGPFTLSDAQINDLESGLWYVNVTSEEQPGVPILRGQILQVPEPSVFALFFAATGILLTRLRARGGNKSIPCFGGLRAPSRIFPGRGADEHALDC